MSASARRVLGRLVASPSPGQTNSELVLIAGIAVLIIIALGITFRDDLTSGAEVIAARISCAVQGGSACGGSGPGSASGAPARNAYGLVTPGSPPASAGGPVPTNPTLPTSATIRSTPSHVTADPPRAAPGGDGGQPASGSRLGDLASGVLGASQPGSPGVVIGGLSGTGLGPSSEWLPRGTPGGTPTGPPASGLSEPVAGVVREIDDYTQQFKGTKFGERVQVGDPKKFEAAAGRNINRVVVGAEGKKLVDARPGGGSDGYHNGGLRTADLAFPFVPGAETDYQQRRKQQRTMMHEMTHHIEWQNGVKKRGPTVIFGVKVRDGDPAAERNTAYQDQVVDALRQWALFEPGIHSGRWPPKDGVARWRQLQTNLRELEAGRAANGNPPDANLATRTGFTATAQAIRDYYLSPECNCPRLKEMVELAEAEAAAEAAAPEPP